MSFLNRRSTWLRVVFDLHIWLLLFLQAETDKSQWQRVLPSSYFTEHVVVDLKVLVSSVYDDDPEHIKISFGESFFSSWRK